MTKAGDDRRAPLEPVSTWQTAAGKSMTGRRCRANKKGGDRCERRAAENANVCRMHGGGAPQVRAAAKQRAVEAAAREEVARRWTSGEDGPVADPLEQLARVAGEIVAFKDYLRERVEKLEDTLTYWTERAYDDGTELHTAAVENVRAVVAAYERALDRTAKVLATMVKLDLQGRMVAIREEQATMIVDAIRAGLAEVDMATAVRSGAEAAIAARIEALAGPPVGIES